MKNALVIFAGATAALHGTAAHASDAIILPNGVTVPYYGQVAPTFTRSQNGDYFSATDPSTGSRYFYTAGGRWIGTQGSDGLPLSGLPTMPDSPSTVALPNGVMVPYRGFGTPELATQNNGFFSIRDPFWGNLAIYDPQGNFVGGSSTTSGGALGYGATVVNGSSSFGSTYLPTASGSSSFGSSGMASTGSGGTSSAGTSGGTGTSGGGGTDVPAPGMVVLFGLGAAAVMAARSRRKKD